MAQPALRHVAAGVLLVVLTARATPVVAEQWWTQEEADEEFVPRLRLAPHIGMWVGEFDRTQRACRPNLPDFGFDPTVEGGVPDGATFQGFCATDDSAEVGLSGGLSAVYRVLGPVHLTVGIDVAFTFPEYEWLEGQVIFSVPIAVGLTQDEWSIRPIADFVLLPYVSLPDLRRGFSYGGQGGIAARIPDLAEVQFLIGYHASADWQMVIVRAAGYLP